MDQPSDKLPAGIQSFTDIRKRGAIYVDKTFYLAKLLSKDAKSWFLTRPRRFGKSLTVSTLEAVFSGDRKPFANLAIEPSLADPRFRPRPVIRLDMGGIATDRGVDGLKRSLSFMTAELASSLGFEISADMPASDILLALIRECSRKHHDGVAVLIDEYDAPYLAFMNETDEIEKVRRSLSSYFAQLKTADESISFIFVTGASQFVRMGVSPALNSLTDISLLPEFSAICGFTQEEVETVFERNIVSTASRLGIGRETLLERIREHYGGFSFDGTARVYNPYSMARFFSAQSFGNFWFEPGSPWHVAEYLENRHLTAERFRGMSIGSDSAHAPLEPDQTSPAGFLYQAGYLTLRPGRIDRFFTLDYPNREVYEAISRIFLANIAGSDAIADGMGRVFLESLEKRDLKAAFEVYERLLARTPFDDYLAAERMTRRAADDGIGSGESLYRALFLAVAFMALPSPNPDVSAEEHGRLGRSDIRLTHLGQPWVFRIMVIRSGDAEATAQAALDQILETGCGDTCIDPILVGVAIDGAKRSLSAWKTLPALPDASGS